MELIECIEQPGISVLELRATHLDASNVREFKDLAALQIGEGRKVVLDLSGVTFVDSSGLGALIALLRQLNGRQGDLALCSLTPNVQALFELMRMHRVFKLHETRADAVHGLQTALAA